MNSVFEKFSLEAGGAHYPSINPHLQEKFGELIVQRIIEKIEEEIEVAYAQGEDWTAATLQALAIDILDEFVMEIPDVDPA